MPTISLNLFIFFILTISAASQKSNNTSITLPNCQEKCGNITIPYPFGLTEKCSLPSFNLTCENTYNPPKLFIPEGYEITDISLSSSQLSITIGALKQCYKPSPPDDSDIYGSNSNDTNISLNLQTDSPYRLSTHNKFTAMGCATYAYITDSNGAYASACVSICERDGNVRDGECSGVGCCQSTIPSGLRYYKPAIDNSSLASVGDINPCSFAFVVDPSQFDYETTDRWLIGDFSTSLLLDWAIRTKSSCDEAKSESTYACRSKNSFCVDSTNDVGYLCSCSNGYQGNPYLTDGCQASQSNNTSETLSNCQHKCGNITIPYPFGLTEDCSLSSFDLICNDTYNPPKLFIPEGFEINSISLTSSQLSITAGVHKQCYNSSGDLVDGSYENFNLETSPYRLSTENRFTTIGCATFAAIANDFDTFSACASICSKDSNITDGQCSGVGCCQSAIPSGVTYYSPTIFENLRQSFVADINPCGYAFVADPSQFSFKASDLLRTDSFSTSLLLDWAIRTKSSCSKAVGDSTYACRSANSFCVDSTNDFGYLCSCSEGYQGNPYSTDGCRDIDECSLSDRYPCYGTCTNTIGSYKCECPPGQTGNATIKGDCHSSASKDNFTPALKGVTVSLASIFSIAFIGFWVYFGYQKRNLIRMKQQFFEQNGGLLMQQQMKSLGSTTFKIFTNEELVKATNNFDSKRILGRGGHGTVYKGTLEDERVVAIKKAKILDESQVKEFAKEMLILSVINHKNVVKILGCCLEVEVPMLVYEYIPNGTLFYYLHNKGEKSTISLDMRLKIAIESADALGYLHSSASPPILHGDIKSANILLDDNFTAKVSDFGASKLAPNNEAQLATMVQGTCGYLDPEYMMTCQLTSKSDVYSFGVVLLELLTGQKALNLEAPEEKRCLASIFLTAMSDDRLADVLDVQVMQEGGLFFLQEIAEVIKRCLSITGEERPTMKEVSEALEALRKLRQQSSRKIEDEETDSLISRQSEFSTEETMTSSTF